MDPIRTFIRRPIFTTMLVLSIVVFGVFAYPKIGVDQFPKVEFPVVTVITVLPGADPETIEKNVSEPLEEALNTLAGLDTLRSVNLESVSQVVMRFDLKKDPDIAAQEVRDRVQATLMKLPQEIQTPVVEKFDIGSAPIATLALSGTVDIQELTRIAEDVVKPALQRIPGAGGVDIVGGRKREISIVIDPARLRSYGLAASDVVQALKLQSIDVPGGRTYEGVRERIVTLQSEVQSIAELGQLVIAAPMGASIRVRDVAEIVDGPAEARSTAALDGKSAVALVVRKQSGANTVAVAEEIKEVLPEINQQLGEGAQVSMVVDGARFIRASIAAVQHDLIIGAGLAVLIVLVFLRNLRSTIVAAVALPTSIIGTFAVMQVLDFTFNVVTMLALTLSIGLLVDDAIVVIENIVRHIEEGKSPKEAAHAATKQIALAVLAVTLSVVAVFIPVAFMDGMMGMFFYEFGVTVAVSVIISYAVSMTLTPMMSSRLISHHVLSGRLVNAIERGLLAIEAFYKRVLRGALDRPKTTVAAAVGLLVLTFMLAGFLKFTFMPAQDMSIAKVTVELPAGTALTETETELESLRQQIQTLPGVVNVFAMAGGGVQEEVQKGELIVSLVPISERSFNQAEFKDHLRNSLVRRADTKLSVLDYNPIQGGGARPQQIQFNLRSDNWEELVAAAEKTGAYMRTITGLVDVDSTHRAGKPELTVKPDRERAAAVGVPAVMVGQTLRTLLGGDKITTYREKGNTYDVKVRLTDAARNDPEAVGSLTVRTPTGQLAELRSLASIEPGEGTSQLERQALKRQITLLADPYNYSLGEAIGALTAFAQKELPKSIIFDFEGMGRELVDAAIAFLVALLLGVVLLYMILAAQFESLLDPFTIMLSLPLALIGAIGALLITGEYLSMFAMIGIIMLMGLVAKNGILLIDFANQLREQGLSTREALLQAGPMRLRPILMTTVAMIAGMMPVALAQGDGAETRVPMAVAIIGGLISSTVLTLAVVPVVYSLLDRRRRRTVEATAPLAAAPEH